MKLKKVIIERWSFYFSVLSLKQPQRCNLCRECEIHSVFGARENWCNQKRTMKILPSSSNKKKAKRIENKSQNDSSQKVKRGEHEWKERNISTLYYREVLNFFWQHDTFNPIQFVDSTIFGLISFHCSHIA